MKQQLNKFGLFDLVDKKKGYRFPGKIVSIFHTNRGEVRYVVEMEKYFLYHIFAETQLRRRRKESCK